MKKACLSMLLLSTSLSSMIASSAPAVKTKDGIIVSNTTANVITHVIYITLDGTRWQDLYLDHKNFPILWSKYANKLTFYGKPHNKLEMEAATTPVSLPSYQAQLSGTVQPCDENDCGRIKVETFPEYLINSGTLKKTDVVTFASWAKINNALEHVKGTTTSFVGNYPVVDPFTNAPDEVMAQINKKQEIDHPPLDPEDGPERYDKYTFAQALHYYQKYQPRFMWISFVDADEAGHDNNHKAYQRALSFYDSAFDKLFMTLKQMGADKNTMVIVTTDHGRGHGKDWIDHGPQLPETKKTWAFVMNGSLQPVTNTTANHRFSTLSIRPTIEAIFIPKAS
jgi:hypothetical protein